jgi:hypothetical protein
MIRLQFLAIIALRFNFCLQIMLLSLYFIVYFEYSCPTIIFTLILQYFALTDINIDKQRVIILFRYLNYIFMRHLLN